MLAQMTEVERSAVYRVDPLQDRRWDDFVLTQPCSSVFHSRAWLEALRRMYGYQPVVYTTSPQGGAIENGIVFCRVSSWLTGGRLVSVPFSDHCQALVEDEGDLHAILKSAEADVVRDRLRYLEMRGLPGTPVAAELPHSTYPYYVHRLDLRPSLTTLFKSLHKSSTQRKILRADREGLTYKEGRSESLLREFYQLLLLTRKRHGVPPQPQKWFSILADSFGDALKIRVAYHNGQPAAAILTLHHRDTLVYKYGCSDANFHRLGVMHLLLWKSIEEGNQDGMRTLDLGRSNLWNQGLNTFKDRWGTDRTTVTYTRYTTSGRDSYGPDGTWPQRIAKATCSRLPIWALRAVGECLYRHVG